MIGHNNTVGMNFCKPTIGSINRSSKVDNRSLMKSDGSLKLSEKILVCRNQWSVGTELESLTQF